jgi:DNA-binding transcriptional ArsR family regulator
MAVSTKDRTSIEKRLEAMAYPLRRDILRILNERVASPVEIARELGVDTPKVSHHTKRLVALDCAELVSERKVRGAVQHFYRAIERTQVDTDEWDELCQTNPDLARHLVGHFMQAFIDDFVASGRAGMVGSDKNFHLTRTPLVFDARGMAEGMEAQDRCRLEMLDIERRSAERRKEDGSDAIHVSSCQGCFEIPAPGAGG